MSSLGVDDNYNVDRVEQILREDGMDILNDEMLSPIFNEDNRTNKNLPAFLRSEVKFGEILGTGAFGVVREVKIIKLVDATESDSKTRSNEHVKSKSDLISMFAGGRQDSEKSFSSAASRDLMSAMCVRQGESRYAVKYLMVEDSTEDQQARARVDLAIEVNYLKALSHPHIVKIRGVMKTENPFHPIFFFLMDRLYGTLHDRIIEWDERKRRKSLDLTHIFLKTFEAPKYQNWKNEFLKERLFIANDIASAISYLHSRRVIHRDIKKQNIGFDIRGNVKVFDFGLAKSLRDDRLSSSGYYNLTAKAGSVPYMAPEVSLGKTYNEKCDVFSFGILLYEIVSLKPPFKLAIKKDYARKVAEGGKRPHIKSCWPLITKDILQSSWAVSPLDRPSMSLICKMLQSNLEELENEENIQARLENIANASWHSSKHLLDFDSSLLEKSKHRPRSFSMFVP